MSLRSYQGSHNLRTHGGNTALAVSSDEEAQLAETYRYQAVREAICTMHERFAEPLTLEDLSRVTHLSPFYLNRVFRSITGVSPSVFLAAIRLEQARKLLLHTNRSVTEVCFDVGYNSMGTFTRRFHLFVGMPPSRFRLFAQDRLMEIRPQELAELIESIEGAGCINCGTVLPHMGHIPAGRTAMGPCVCGTVEAIRSQGIANPFSGLIFVGMFRDPLPQGQPVSCAILTRPGAFHLPLLPVVPDGKYYLFAAAMDHTQNLFDILNSDTYLHAGLGRNPLIIRNGRPIGRTDMQLTTANWSDPPQLIALPWLLLSRFAEAGIDLTHPVSQVARKAIK